MDYMRVFKFNFHLKDFKDRVPDRNERKSLSEHRVDSEEEVQKRMKLEYDHELFVHNQAITSAVVAVVALLLVKPAADTEEGSGQEEEEEVEEEEL